MPLWRPHPPTAHPGVPLSPLKRRAHRWLGWIAHVGVRQSSNVIYYKEQISHSGRLVFFFFVAGAASTHRVSKLTGTDCKVSIDIVY